MAQKAKKKKVKVQPAVVTMVNLIRSAISTTTLMATLKGNFGDLFSAILVATSEYIIDEAERHGADPDKFLNYYTTKLKECVKQTVEDLKKIESETDKNAS